MSEEQQQIADNQKGAMAEIESAADSGQIGKNDGDSNTGPNSSVGSNSSGDQQALTELDENNGGVGQANGGNVEKPMEVGDKEGPKDEGDKNGGGELGQVQQQQKAATPGGGSASAHAEDDEQAPLLIEETILSSSTGAAERDGSREHAPSGNNDQQQKRRQKSGSSSGSKVVRSSSRQHVQAVQQQPPQQLRIQRVFRNEEGVEIQQTETITDPRLIENYLKMRMMCDRDQLWQYALGGEEDEKDHRALLRRLQKRFQYHAKKQREQQKKLARVGQGRKVLAKKASMSIRIRKQQAKGKRTFSIPLGGPTTTAAEQGPSPSSSGYSTTSGGGAKGEDAKPEEAEKPKPEMPERQKDGKNNKKQVEKNAGNGEPEEAGSPEMPEPEEDQKSETPEGMNRGGRRSAARRSNAGVKRRYSPGAELLRPQMATGHRRKLTGEAVVVTGVMLPAGQ